MNNIDLMSDENLKAIIEDVIKNPPPSEKLIPMNIGEDGIPNIPDLMDFINKGYFAEQADIVEAHAKSIDWHSQHCYVIHYTKWHYRIDRFKKFLKAKITSIKRRLI